jgi:hypothetical protein
MCAALLFPASALAAEATSPFVPSTPATSPGAPNPPSTETLNAPLAKIASIDVQVWPAELAGASTPLIVVATLPTATPLPAKVRMPLPKGARVTWSGEIFNGGPSADEQRPFKTVSGTGGDAVEIVVQKTRDVQYEADYTPARDVNGRRVATLEWVETVATGPMHVAFKLPAVASDVKTTPAYTGQPQANEQGERLYILPERTLKVGEKFTASVDYLPRMAVPESPTGGRDLLVPGLIALLVAVVAILLFLVARQRRAE